MRRTLTCAALWSLAAAGALSAELTGPDWPQHRGGGGSTGVSQDDSVKPPLRLVWSYRCDADTTGDAGAGMTVAGGKVFCNMEMSKSIMALDAATGKFCWEFSHPDVHYMQTSAFADGKLLVWLHGWGRSNLVALDSATGKEVWSRKLTGSGAVVARRFGPAVADGKVLLADGGGKSDPEIVCLEAANGNELWRRKLDKDRGNVVVSPSVAGGLVFTGTRFGFKKDLEDFMRGAVYALKLSDGSVVWKNEAVLPSRPIVSDGEIAIVKFAGEPGMPQGKQKIWALSAADGKELWSIPIWVVQNTTSLTKDLVLVRSGGSAMTAYDRKTGQKLWSYGCGHASGCGSPAISGKYAYIGTGSFHDSEPIWAWRFTEPPHRDDKTGQEGVCWTLHAIDLETRKSAWQFVTGNNVCGEPAIAYGRVYANSRDGRIYCFEPVKAGEPALPDSPDKSPNAPAEEVGKLLAEKAPEPRPGKDWPMLGGTPERTGLPVTLTPPLAPAWKLDTGGRVLGAAAIRDGRVFVGSLSGKILAADLATGAKAWEFDAGGEVRCSPAVADGVVYCGSGSGKMFALDAATGREKWSYACGGPVEASPAVVGGALVFGANDGHIYMLDRKSGRKLWSLKGTLPLVGAPPVVRDGRVYAAQWIDWVYALDAASGKQVWRSCVPISIEALHFYNGKLWLRSAYEFCEYDPATGKRLRIGNAPYGYNGLAFMGKLMLASNASVDLDDPGKPSYWAGQSPVLKDLPEMKPGGGMPGQLWTMSTPLVVGDMFCLAARNGNLALVKPEVGPAGGKPTGYKIVWNTRLGGTCHSSPVAADGHLVVGCDDGNLHAFRGK